MAVLQRRRGVEVVVHPSVETEDRRGNRTVRPLGDPVTVKAWLIPDRSAKAEVPGQQDIEVYLLGTKDDIGNVDIWSRVEWNGKWWDLASPPALHMGTRHSRHWTFTLRKRPDDGGLDVL